MGDLPDGFTIAASPPNGAVTRGRAPRWRSARPLVNVLCAPARERPPAGPLFRL
jgi:hypothetical protein